MSHRGPMKRHLSHCPWNDAFLQGYLKLISIRIIIELHSSAPSHFLYSSAFLLPPCLRPAILRPLWCGFLFALTPEHHIRPSCSTSPPFSHHQGPQVSRNPATSSCLPLSLFFFVSLAVSGSQLWTCEVTVFPCGKHFYGARGGNISTTRGCARSGILFFFSLSNCERNSGIPGITAITKLLGFPEV